MMFSKKIFMASCLLLLCLSQSGCALLALPFQAAGTLFSGLFKLGSQALAVAQSVPTPPPWMFF